MAIALTAELVEREYNNRALVPDHAAYFERWERDSAFVRETLPASLDLTYGPDARHRLDLFPAASARGTLVFIHGGYWRSLDKSMFSWIAAPWVASGVNVALVNYRLCPAATLEQIVEDVILAMSWLFPNAERHGVDLGRVVVSGHSAGGHLTAALLAAPREALGFDPARIAGAVPISGIYDFAPLRLFSFNADFQLDDARIERLDLARRARSIAAPIVVAVGGEESREFRRQSRLLADAWGPQVKSLLLLPGLHHFSVVDALAERGQPLHEQALALF